MNGRCLLCGNEGELTFEHVPPQSAYNNRPIFVQRSDHLIERTSFVYGKKMKSHRGFGGYTLCIKCNNNTGAWYGKDFCDFARQGMGFLTGKVNSNYVEGEYVIKPLNVIKQILTMFMSATKTGELQSNEQLVAFILNKDSTNFPKQFKVFIYSNASSVKRMIGHSVVFDLVLGIQKWSEINFQPFGYLLAESSVPAHPLMKDITDFSTCSYDVDYRVRLKTVYLKVSSMNIGLYG